jgi:predicted DNA-binding ribbon-helix-helix protein
LISAIELKFSLPAKLQDTVVLAFDSRMVLLGRRSILGANAAHPAERLPFGLAPVSLPPRRRAMRSPVVKRSIVVAGHKTSVSLEDAFWNALREIAGERQMTLSDLVAAIDSQRQHGNLSSAIRLFVLDFYRNLVSVEQEERDGKKMIMITRRHDADHATPDDVVG